MYVSTVNLSCYRLVQFTTTRHILKQHICTLTRLLILILLLIAGIEANPGPNMHYIEYNELKQHYVQYSQTLLYITETIIAIIACIQTN